MVTASNVHLKIEEFINSGQPLAMAVAILSGTGLSGVVDPRDIVQQAATKVLDSKTEIENVEAFVTSAIKNAINDELRKSKRSKVRPQSSEQLDSMHGTDATLWNTALEESLLRVTDSAHMLAAHTYKHLCEGDAEALKALDYHLFQTSLGCTKAEASKNVGCSRETARKKYERLEGELSPRAVGLVALFRELYAGISSIDDVAAELHRQGVMAFLRKLIDLRVQDLGCGTTL